MFCERSLFLMLLECWERRIGCRLYVNLGHYDPVKEITRRLYPNDHPEAQFCLEISYRSLAWPFTPFSRFRHSPTLESVS